MGRQALPLTLKTYGRILIQKLTIVFTKLSIQSSVYCSNGISRLLILLDLANDIKQRIGVCGNLSALARNPAISNDLAIMFALTFRHANYIPCIGRV